MGNLKLLYVYIIKCADNTYYTGVTNNFEQRVAEHNEGTNPNSYTFYRRPVELVYVESFQNFQQAIAVEKQIKGWSKKKKEALIRQDWDKLKKLAVCKNSSSHINFKNENESLT